MGACANGIHPSEFVFQKPWMIFKWFLWQGCIQVSYFKGEIPHKISEKWCFVDWKGGIQYKCCIRFCQIWGDLPSLFTKFGRHDQLGKMFIWGYPPSLALDTSLLWNTNSLGWTLFCMGAHDKFYFFHNVFFCDKNFRNQSQIVRNHDQRPEITGERGRKYHTGLHYILWRHPTAYGSSDKFCRLQNQCGLICIMRFMTLAYQSSPGVLEFDPFCPLLVGVFPGVFDAMERFNDFLGVSALLMADLLVFMLPFREQLIMDSLREALLWLSLHCQRICGPRVIGASIRKALRMSFSRLNWLIVAAGVCRQLL